ncbi:glycoside hydrolase family 3 N-terminal domain-containing protein [Methylocella sp.]|uniref:glycoside hydrolase family 3 N-terminal domain-containing protein n=1 Tax=Methylocella sp. TaxID=1978226 RepID=UPI003784EDFA
MTADDIENLLAAMTLAEKIGQMTMAAGTQALTGPVAGGEIRAAARAGLVGSLLNLWGAHEVAAIQAEAERARLKIPLFIGFDVVHGHRSIFPIPLAETCAFDPDLWEKTAAAAAAEARADGIHLVFAPMIDVARDPRWGRIAEGPGEDPYVASLFAAAKTRGFQGGNLADPARVAACAKHFCAYGAAEAGRDYASADVSDRTLREVYAPPFAAAIAAGCASIMPAFMDLAGVPMTAHDALIEGWLRRAQGFDGVVISDYNAVAELMAHGVAADRVEAAALALKAGVDVDMMSFCYRDGLPEALARGLVSIAAVDAAVRRVLRLKARLGLFRRAAAPAVASPPPEPEAPAALALEAARRSLVLLTNRGALPLPPGVRRIALVGPLADAPCEMDGPWAGAGAREAAVSIRRGLAELLPDVELLYAQGAPIDGGDDSGVNAALAACRAADAVVLCLGEAAEMSGEAASRTSLGLPGRQRGLAEAVLDLAAETKKPAVALLSSGRPLVVPWLFARADAVVATWFLGEAAGTAIAEALVGRVDPVGRLPVAWPRAEGQTPIYFARRPTGRPFAPGDHYSSRYLDCEVEPQFPFGHGLSYGAFMISSFAAGSANFRRGDTLRFRVELRNDGPRDGEAVVFLFARDLVASVARPLLELKRFGRLALRAHESGALAFSLPAGELAFLGRDLTPVFEPGGFEFCVGFSADPAALVRLRCEARA